MNAPGRSEGDADRRFSKYQVITELGRGGMADVHLTVLRGLAGAYTLVVVKQISPQLLGEPEYLGMFLDEIRITARLDHPNVVKMHEVGEEGGLCFMAMEYLEGQTLHRVLQRLKSKGGLPLAMHLRILVDALAGLDHAHDLTDPDGAPLGIVHRDATPQNIFVTYEGGVKLVDFGLAKARGAAVQTRVGVLKGKIAYMAPEQVAEQKLDRRADLFAVGVMLWEAATGSRLWGGKSDLSIASELLAGNIPRPSEARPDVPARLEAIIVKALSLDPADRHATAAELAAEITAFLAESGQLSPTHERDLGRLLAQQFADDRARIRACVELYLSADVEPEVLLSSGGLLTPARSAGRKPRAPLPVAAPEPAVLEEEVIAPTQVSARIPRAPKRRSAFGWALATALVGGLVFASFSLGRRALPPTSAQSAASLAPLSAPLALEIPASPPEAKLLDEPLAANPAKLDPAPAAAPSASGKAPRPTHARRRIDKTNPYAAVDPYGN